MLWTLFFVLTISVLGQCVPEEWRFGRATLWALGEVTRGSWLKGAPLQHFALLASPQKFQDAFTPTRLAILLCDTIQHIKHAWAVAERPDTEGTNFPCSQQAKYLHRLRDATSVKPNGLDLLMG